VSGGSDSGVRGMRAATPRHLADIDGRSTFELQQRCRDVDERPASDQVSTYYVLRESWTTQNVLWSPASVCLSVCLPARGRMPTLLHGPRCNLGYL